LVAGRDRVVLQIGTGEQVQPIEARIGASLFLTSSDSAGNVASPGTKAVLLATISVNVKKMLLPSRFRRLQSGVQITKIIRSLSLPGIYKPAGTISGKQACLLPSGAGFGGSDIDAFAFPRFMTFSNLSD
jgi:hypothetical protein